VDPRLKSKWLYRIIKGDVVVTKISGVIDNAPREECLKYWKRVLKPFPQLKSLKFVWFHDYALVEAIEK